MPRYFAFLRAINVGGHVVRMEVLRQVFTALGFACVETFIASGNVVFETLENDGAALEQRIAERLHEELGYDVATFVRTAAELADIAGYQPFSAPALEGARTLNIGFTSTPLDGGAEQKLQALRTDIDEFRVHGREVYWLCRTRQSESTFSNAVLEKTLGRPSTLRGASSVAKMAAKWAPETRPER
jgi:uncharacterized protein (DUF1697 family)